MHTRRTRARCAALLALTGVVIAAGCQATPAHDGDALRAEDFRAALGRTTEAIRAGDLEQARAHLDAADAAVVTDAERNKVASLDHLISGAEALMTGDAGAAGTQWSLIEDAALQQQVAMKARGVGMIVPAPASESEVTP